MSDVIRCNFTPEEAAVLVDLLMEDNHATSGWPVGDVKYGALVKLFKSMADPLNGPTFPTPQEVAGQLRGYFHGSNDGVIEIPSEEVPF